MTASAGKRFALASAAASRILLPAPMRMGIIAMSAATAKKSMSARFLRLSAGTTSER